MIIPLQFGYAAGILHSRGRLWCGRILKGFGKTWIVYHGCVCDAMDATFKSLQVTTRCHSVCSLSLQ